MQLGGFRALCALVAVLAVAGAAFASETAVTGAKVPLRVPLPRDVLGTSIADALFPGSADGAAFDVSRDGVVLMETSNDTDADAVVASGFRGQEVTGLMLSLGVPLPVPTFKLKVSVEGKMFSTDEPRSIKLMGALTVQMEFDVGPITLHAGASGMAMLHSREHETAGDMLADMARYIFSEHKSALEEEVSNFLGAIDGALKDDVSAEAAWKDAQVSFWRGRDAVGDAMAELKAGKPVEALAALGGGAAELGEGAWPAHGLPVLCKGAVGEALAKPYADELEKVGSGMGEVLAKFDNQNGLNYRQMRADASDNSASGEVVLLVRRAAGLGKGADWSLFGSSAAKTDAYVRVTSDVAQEKTSVVSASVPAWMEELRVVVASRESTHGRALQIELMDEDLLRDDTVATFALDLAKIAGTPNTLHAMTLQAEGGGGATLDVVARWVPFTTRDAFAQLGVPDSKGLMAVGGEERLWMRRGYSHIRSRVHRKVHWEYTRNHGNTYSSCRTATDLPFAKQRTKQPELRRLCAFLQASNPRLPDRQDHVTHVLRQLLVENKASANEQAARTLEPQLKQLREAVAAVAAVAAGDDAAREEATSKLAALHAALSKVSSDRWAFVRAMKGALAAHLGHLRAEAHTLREDVEVLFPAEVHEASRAAEEARTRGMTVDFTFFLRLGLHVSWDDWIGAKATVGTGHGVRGVLGPELKKFSVTVGGVEGFWDGGKVTVAALHREFDDGSKAMVITVDAQLPIELEETAEPGDAVPQALVEKALVVVRGAEAAAQGSIEAHGRLAAALMAVLGQIEDDDGLEIAGVGANYKVVPGVLGRLFFEVGKDGKWHHAKDRALAYVYVMSEYEASVQKELRKKLGVVSEAADRVVSVQSKLESGVWWPLLQGGRTATTAMAMADVIAH